MRGFLRALPALWLTTLCFGTPALAGDFYVVQGAKGGDGSKEKPFGDPYYAVDKAVSGDVIHVAQGVYHGKLSTGFIVIDKPGLTLAGGYKDGTFAERNPFLYPTQIAEDPASKGSSFDGGYFRAGKAGATTVHDSTTIDGFWFDRKGQNTYGEGSLQVPTGSNTKPVIDFEHVDCHIRNCVFLNTALYALRVNGDGSSVENCLFVNINYCGIEVFGKGRKIGKGYPFWKFTFKNNTFFGIWNAASLEAGAGSAIAHSGNAELEVTDNIFCLSMGQPTSQGWAMKDLKNFKADRWIKFHRNSCSQLRGGIYLYYDPDTTASIGVWELEQLPETALDEPEGNDLENPFYELDPDWFEHYTAVVPHEDVSNKKVNMDDYNKWARLLGKPLQDGPRKMGANWAYPYPLEGVKKGTFWTVKSPALAGRGVQANGPFPIVRGALLGEAGGEGGEAADEVPAGDFQEIEWDALMTEGESLVDKPIKLKCYYEKWDTVFGSGSGKAAVPFLAGADPTTHKILALREVPETDKGATTLKGYVKLGTAGANYVDRKAKRPGGRGVCDFSFVVYAIVRKPGAKLFGKGPQIVLEVQSIASK